MITNSSTQVKAGLLRSALLGNSVFCFLSGLDFTLFSQAVAEFLGFSSPRFIFVLGLVLIAYAGIVFAQSRKQPVSIPFARLAIAADLLWVLGSAALVFTNVVAFTTAGKWAIAIIADIVLVFAILQYAGLRRMTGQESG